MKKQEENSQNAKVQNFNTPKSPPFKCFEIVPYNQGLISNNIEKPWWERELNFDQFNDLLNVWYSELPGEFDMFANFMIEATARDMQISINANKVGMLTGLISEVCVLQREMECQLEFMIHQLPDINNKIEQLESKYCGKLYLDCSRLPIYEKFVSYDLKMKQREQHFANVYEQMKSVKNKIDFEHVRGAPAIAIVGCLSLAIELPSLEFTCKTKLRETIVDKLNYLVTARPTAVNMKLAADSLTRLSEQLEKNNTISYEKMIARLVSTIVEMLEKDLTDNRAIGKFGSEAILAAADGSKVRILTHCNTGSLATAGYGTALGVIRALHEKDKLEHVYCTETRPYNQGARLTAYELVHEKMPATLICDSAVAALMNSTKISAVVVGADRVAANGDTANKIGTYQIAVTAKHHNVPFYVAAPFTSIDKKLSTGKEIVIEERPEKEMTHVANVRIAVPGISCWNPAFDVTPAELITGIITEKGVFSPGILC